MESRVVACVDLVPGGTGTEPSRHPRRSVMTLSTVAGPAQLLVVHARDPAVVRSHGPPCALVPRDLCSTLPHPRDAIARLLDLAQDLILGTALRCCCRLVDT